MTTPDKTSLGGEGGGLQCFRVQTDHRRSALGLLLTGEAAGDSPAVDEFLRFAGEQSLDLTELWAAQDGPHMLCTALIVPSAGRTGMVFCSPIRSREGIGQMGELLRCASGAQDASRMSLLQCLLDPYQHREERALAAAGFKSLASLLYLQREVEPLHAGGAASSFGEGLHAVRWTPQHAELFERAILASYEQTLDCPGLVGLRDIGDIVAGHMATGRFDPEMWMVLLDGELPAAVLLLNELPGRSAIELVYLGVSAPWRGKGLAGRLMEYAIDLTARRGCESMLLAVDEANTPARRLYRGLGFRPTTRKHAMIRVLA